MLRCMQQLLVTLRPGLCARSIGRVMATCGTQQTSEAAQGPDPSVFRLMSWNIDGLDERDAQVRVLAVCDTILRLAPDVVFLQEVVAFSQLVLAAKLSSKYDIIPAGQMYYVCTLVRKLPECRVTSREIIPFPNTKMMRNLLKVKASYRGIYLSLMNTHLESTGPEASQRKVQLKSALTEMQEEDGDRVVIFGGDTNLRDKEVASIGGIPAGVADLWEVCGSDSRSKYTWDTAENDNLSWGEGRSRPKLRFDRLYQRPAAGHAGNLAIRSFQLVGKTRLPSCGRFPSDHWGIVCDFDMIPAEF
ncbi:tyrosyl-DNA phosphodiesterase 2-like [Diadema antillarum]|uniref:tyrosyl-DNA phosphodiesterase 2-like n=1 Tax=Diadema antillarum TaxID=105358 RepID=UPI003A858770